jgi:hypothetical protein
VNIQRARQIEGRKRNEKKKGQRTKMKGGTTERQIRK